MTKYSTRLISDSGTLVVAMMLSNGLNFVYNAYLGRNLSFEEFGLITLVNTFLFIATMFLSGFGSTINHRVAYLFGAHKQASAIKFFTLTRRNALFFVLVLAFFWMLSATTISRVFQIEDPHLVLVFSPVFLFLVFMIAGRSFLSGTFAFGQVALIYLTESITKLVSVFILVNAGYSSYAYLSIPFSIVCAAIVSAVILFGRVKKPKIEDVVLSEEIKFPFSFYFAAIFSGLSTTAFLSIDVLLAKHYLPPVQAGEYALLSLVGKMVYFSGSLLNAFMIPYVSRDLGKGKNPNTAFYTLFALEAFLALNAFALFGLLGFITIPFLFGEKSLTIVPYLTLYTFGIVMFTLTNTIVQYRLIRHNYVFPVLAILNAVAMYIGIVMFHSDVNSIATVVATTAILGFIVISICHVIADQGRYIFRNMIDLFDLFTPVGNEEEVDASKKRVLIFNWRDIKHTKAGGAEVYVHELAKRWVGEGNKVTVFCGNDGNCPRYEEIDGVEIVRRGGFYFVYIWAFLYYLLKFRGKYDVIVDCENGIPFFTPLYTKERQFLVIHHVHVDVFKRSLKPPFRQLAVFFETQLMPYVYENVEVITVSPSSKKEIEESGITKGPIHVIYNGVNIEQYTPGKKAEVPTILLLGRLQEYKSVDVFVKAAQKVLEKISNAQFIVAGDGEERKKLEDLAKSLHISDRIKFLGKVTHEMKVHLYRNAWIFVNTSFREGWGITTIEANACGTPVVASRVAGLIDSVKNPHTGYLVEYGNVEEFADRIGDLLIDEVTRNEMSRQSVNWAKEYSWDVSAKKAWGVLFNV